MEYRRQHITEEIANTAIHTAGLGLSIAALVILVIRTSLYGDAWQVTGVSIFGASLVLLYFASSLYHGLSTTRTRPRLHIFDRCAIYILIAGTYTPFLLITLRGGWGWSLFGLIWGLALFGILLSSVSARKFPQSTCILYLLMGWLILVAAVPATRNLTPYVIAWLLAGGLAYSFGVLFFLSTKPFRHTLWHITVLAGSTCHFFALLAIIPHG